MVKFRELTKTLTLRSIQLSATEEQQLIQRAAREMVERSVLGTIIVPLCFAMAVVVSGYGSLAPYSCLVLTFCMLTSAVVRHLAITRVKKYTDQPLSTWVQLFLLACLGMAAVWGILTAIFIYTYLQGFPVLLILILSAGIGAGSMANFCIWKVLAINYLLLSFVPAILVGFLLQQAEIFPTILAMTIFVFYLLFQIKQWNFHFWDSLITAYLFERQAEKLSKANSRLAELIEKEQEALREVEKGKERLRELFNLTNDAMLICTLDGSVLDVNQAMLEMLSGIKTEVPPTFPLQMFAIPEGSDLSIHDHWAKVVAGEEDDFECRITQPDSQGSLLVHVNLRRVTWQEEPIIFITLRDITTSKQMEEALKITKKFLAESEGYLRAILRNVELPIYCKDLDGCYLTVNEPFEQLCCRTLSDLRGKNDLQVFPEKVASFFSFRDAEIVATGESIELEGVFTFGGQEKKLLVHKFPLREGDGFIYATAGICTDVTTVKKALRTAQMANEAKSEFLANMSHELRTPMHSILSIARLGLKRVETSSREKLESYFEMIINSGEQLLELLSDLLDLSTLESSKACYSLKEYDLEKDLEKVINEFRVMMEEREIVLSYQATGSAAMARYDRTKLYQVMRNLLVNAMKFTPPQKKVTVLLKKDYLDINGERQDAWKVMVVDQGIGVEKDELASVFGKFVKGSKTCRVSGGAGLGLSICQRIVEDHHGIIWAEQNEVEGTTFCFLLPALT